MGYGTEKITRTIRNLKKSVKRFVLVWQTGRESGYPWCCVLHYSLIKGLTKDPYRLAQAVNRGGIHRDGMDYVPCVWHKRQAEPFPYKIGWIDEDGLLHMFPKGP